MVSLSLDIEAFGEGRDAVVVQVGIVGFDCDWISVKPDGSLNTQAPVSARDLTLKVNIDPFDAQRCGLHTSPDTMAWWDKQKAENPALEQGLNDPPRLGLNAAMARIGTFLSRHRDLPVWSHLSYDMVTLADSFAAVGQRVPWSWRNTRDIRTLQALVPRSQAQDFQRTTRAQWRQTHDALNDAGRQAHYIQLLHCSLCRSEDHKEML